MICDCDVRMNCIYSIPVGTGRVRYRVFKCPECGKRLETVEMAVEQLGFDTEKIAELIKKGQERRYFALRKFGTKKG